MPKIVENVFAYLLGPVLIVLGGLLLFFQSHNPIWISFALIIIGLGMCWSAAVILGHTKKAGYWLFVPGVGLIIIGGWILSHSRFFIVMS